MSLCPHTMGGAPPCYDCSLKQPTVPGFRVGITAVNPKGQVPFEVEVNALASCIRELSTLDHESRHRVLLSLVDRYEERRKL